MQGIEDREEVIQQWIQRSVAPKLEKVFYGCADFHQLCEESSSDMTRGSPNGRRYFACPSTCYFSSVPGASKKRHLRTRHCSLHTSAYCIQKWLCEARRERLQEMSRGIVNLQNARKIADFPFPFPYHQAGSLVVNACKGQLW